MFCKKNTEKCWEIFWVGRYKIWDTAIGTTCRIFSILLLISIGGKLYLEISFSHGPPADNTWELYRPSASILAPFLIFEHENVPMSNKLFGTRNAGNSIFHKVTLPTLTDNASIPDILQHSFRSPQSIDRNICSALILYFAPFRVRNINLHPSSLTFWPVATSNVCLSDLIWRWWQMMASGFIRNFTLHVFVFRTMGRRYL